MADIELTAAFSTVPAGEAEELKRVLVEAAQQLWPSSMPTQYIPWSCS